MQPELNASYRLLELYRRLVWQMQASSRAAQHRYERGCPCACMSNFSRNG